MKTFEEQAADRRKDFAKTNFSRIERKLNKLRHGAYGVLEPGVLYIQDGTAQAQIQRLITMATMSLELAEHIAHDAANVKKYGESQFSWPWLEGKKERKSK